MYIVILLNAYMQAASVTFVAVAFFQVAICLGVLSKVSLRHYREKSEHSQTAANNEREKYATHI
jgi:hypothetical protein